MQPSAASCRDTYQLVGVLDAARILGVSDSTVRRLVKAGKLEAERVERPQGHVWLVRVPAPATDPSGTRQRLAAAAGAEPSGAPALAAWMTSVLEPLVTELSLMRQANERQAGEVAGLREERGRLTAELDAARTAELDTRVSNRRLTLALAVLAFLLLAAGALAAAGWAR